MALLTIEKLRFGGAHLSQTQIIDEIYDLPECRFNNGPTGARNAETQDGALPEILIATFRNRYVELICDSGLDPLQHSPLALQGMVFRQHQTELKHPYDHGTRD
jgi:hypothetical protein